MRPFVVAIVLITLQAIGLLPVATAGAQQVLAASGPSELRERVETFSADLADLRRRYDTPMSGERQDRLERRYRDELAALAAIDFDALGRDGRVDFLLLEQHLRRLLHDLEQERGRDAEIASLLPFAGEIVRFAEDRRAMQDVDGQAAAAVVTAIGESATKVRDALRRGEHDQLAPAVRERAAGRLRQLRSALQGWFRNRDGYDPMFSWWVRAPHEAADEALGQLGEVMRAETPRAETPRAEKPRAGARGQSLPGGGEIDRTLIGDPIGEQALQQALACEWIPYTPAELVAIAEREFAWCDGEMAKATEELGVADWRAALELTKQSHRAPGEQPELIRDLAHEAIAFLEARDLITVPELAKECWRMSMMSRDAQRVNPFFLGGETIQVSFPTDAMAHIEKLQALRSNNEHFCRATVHHELIPGHWLQQYSQARYRTWRAPFDTPFWIEGWALYWEMRLYDLGLAKSPRDRVGMLYWRKHRCARIVFSLNFHLGQWSGPECVEYLIDRVGHERSAAEGEVRRSVGGAYPPLYQAAYMLGGLQLRAMREELVGAGRCTDRQFHDEVLRQNAMPIAVLRAALSEPLPPRRLADWRF